MKTRIGIIADDLTGAGDAGLQFFRKGLVTWVKASLPDEARPDPRDDIIPGSAPFEGAMPVPRALRDGGNILSGISPELGSSAYGEGLVGSRFEAVAINAGGRSVDPARAVEGVARAVAWLKALGCTAFFHKVDSTLRGNPGPELWRLLHELECDLAIVAPAFPEAGRATIGGFQLVQGVPVALSEYGRDPDSPVRESHVPTLLQSDGQRADLVDLRTVLEGWERIVAAVAEAVARGTRALVVDAARPADLFAIGRAIAQLGPKVLPVGSAGLAQALGPDRRPAGELVSVMPIARPPEERLEIRPGGELRARTQQRPVLAISGSCNPVTLAQIDALRDRARVVLVDVRRLLLTDAQQELETTAREALQGLLAGTDVLVTTATSAEQVQLDQALGHDIGLAGWQIGEQLNLALGALARRLVATAEISGLILTGGQTAAAVCRALGADTFEIVAEVMPTIPVLRPNVAWNRRQESAAGLGFLLVTKSGGFGPPDALGRIAHDLRHGVQVAR